METPTSRISTGRRLSAWVVKLAFLFYLALLATVYCWADEYAGPTLFLFGPRWMAAVPLIALIPLALYSRSRFALVMTLAVGLVVIGPILGGQVSVSRYFGSQRPALQQVRVMTWNMGGSAGGKADLRRFIDEVNPTIVVLQEADLNEEDSPAAWKSAGRGGNRIMSRLPIRDDGFLDLGPIGAPGRVDRFVVETPDGDVLLANVHLPTPRPGLESAIASRGWDLAELRRIIEVRAAASRAARHWIDERGGNRIVVGDFNMPVESRIYRRTWSDLRNAFNDAGLGWGTTKQTRWFGTRIDHILYSTPWRCRRAWVGPAMGSDHRPLIADLEWMEGAD